MIKKQTIYIIGMGTGARTLLTEEAKDALEASDVFIGAKRILDIWPDYNEKIYLDTYDTEEIVEFIKSQKRKLTMSIMFSGDVGFYSGAKKLLKRLSEENTEDTYSVHIIPGIASPIYLCDRLGVAWQDTILVSNHGEVVNLIPLIRDNYKVCSLLGNENTVSEIAKKLIQYNLNVKITVGERLSYSDEFIKTAGPEEFVNKTTDSLSVVLFENENPRQRHLTFGMDDEEFVRDMKDGKPQTPMTKEEVRTLALSKLHLTENGVFYDVGAGTGSVSVEAALVVPSLKVYAIEQKTKARKVLEMNKMKFAADNIEIVSGKAPKVLDKLDMPTHAFIGGSEGNLQDIIHVLLEKNPKVRIVSTAVTMETVAEFSTLPSEFPELADTFEMMQVGVSRSKVLGHYHMMIAENPIYIVCFGGTK